MAATPYVPSITVDTIIEQMIAFLQPFVGSGIPIIRGRTNRVPMPLTGFVELSETLMSGLDTPVELQNPDKTIQQASVQRTMRFDVQVDFYGPSAGEWATAIETVFRSPYCPDQFSGGVAPLFCSDAQNVLLITGEEQFEYRYILTASLEYNPVVVVPQQSATELNTTIFEDLP